MSGRPGDVPIERYFQDPREVAEIDARLAEIDSQHPTQEGDTAMPVNRTPLPANATREEKLAALPKYQRHSAAPATETRLTRLADEAITVLGALDTELEGLADEFGARFAEDDARAASRDRIAQTARDSRRKPRR